MASEKIKYDDLFASDINKQLKELETGLKSVLETQREIIKTGSKGGKTAENIEKTNAALRGSKEARKGLSEVQKQQEAIQKQLQKSTDAEVKGKLRLQSATKAQKDELKDLLILEDKEAGTLEKVAAKSNQLRRERSKLNLETQKGKDRLKEINIQLDKNNQKIRKNSDALKKQKLNVGNYSASVKEGIQTSGLFSRQLFILQKVQATLAIFTKKNVVATEAQAAAQKGAAVASGGFTKALKIVKIALISTGIGAIVVGLGALIAAFAGTQRGADAFTKVLRPLQTLFAKFVGFLEGSAFKVFDKIKEAFSNPKQAIIDLGNAIKQNIINRFLALGVLGKAIAKIFSGEFKQGFIELGDGVVQLSTGITDASGKISKLGADIKELVDESIAQGEQLDALIKKFERRQIDTVIPLAQARIEFQKLKAIANDQLATDEARLKALKEAADVQRFISKTEGDLLQISIDILKKKQSFNDTSREEELELKRLQEEQLIFEEKALKKIAGLKSLSSGIELRALNKQKKAIADTIKFVNSIENTDSENEFIQRTKESTDKYQAQLKKLNENILIEESKKVELRLLLESKFYKELSKIEKDKKLKAKTDNEFEVEQDIQLFNKRIKEAELAGLKEGKTQKEIAADIRNAKIESLENEIALRTELGQDVIDLEIQLEKEKLKKIEDLNAASDKKTASQKLAEFKKVYDSINSELKTQLDKQFAETNKANSDEIAETKDNIKTQQDLAEKGIDNQLAFEEKKLVEAQLKEQEELKKQQKIKEGIALAEAYLVAYTARLKEDPDTAGFRALSDVLLAKGIAQTLVSAFAGYEEGGYTGEYGTSEIAGVVHGKEFVIDAATTKQMGLKGSSMGDFKNKMFSGQLFNHDFITSDMSKAQAYDNTRVVNAVESLENTIKSQPIQQVNVDGLGNLLEIVYKDGIKTVTTHKNKSRRL